MSIAHLMRHAVDIKSPGTPTKDSSSRTVTTEETVVSGLPCNVQPAVSSVVADYLQRKESVDLTMYYTDGTAPITTASKIVWNGVTYRVVGLKYDTQRGLWYRADLVNDQT